MWISITIIIIIFVAVLTELWLEPRIDITPYDDIIIWYGRKKRKYIKL